MQTCLLDINATVNDSGDSLNVEDARRWRERYRKLPADAERECPPPVPTPNKRGRAKRLKARGLLEQSVNNETDVLRFMTEEHVYFTHSTSKTLMLCAKCDWRIY